MASRWVLWLTQKDTPTGGERESFCTKVEGVLSLSRGRVQVLVSKLQVHLSLLSFGYCKVHFSFISRLPVRFLCSGHRRGTEKQDERQFCPCPALHSGVTYDSSL